MTDKEIIQALRCTSTPGGPQEDCTGCTYYRKEQLDAELKEKLGVDTWPSCDVNKVGMDAADIIERLTAENAALREKVPQWVSVDDRLPADHLKRYLIAFKDAGGSIVDAARYIPGIGWECCNWEVPQGLITHWMPLPSAPKFADILRGAPEAPEGGGKADA